MKKSTHIPTDSIERQHYKKKYIERQLEEKEAEKQIREYTKRMGQLPPDEMPYPQSMD